MNKRIKIKKGLLHKRCDDSCINYRIIKEKEMITNNICECCRYKNCDRIQHLLDVNWENGIEYDE